MSSTTVLTPSSAEEAAAAIAADPTLTVIGGGTLVVPHHALGKHEVERAMWLGRAGLDSVSGSGGRTTIGAAAPLLACRELPAPIGPCAANVGDREVQAQATLGGNVCSPAPYGDLRGPLLALDATVRCAGADGEHSVSAADFFADTSGRVVLDVSFEDPAVGAFVPLRRHHTQSLTAIGVSAVRTSAGDVRLAATGVAAEARRLGAAEAAIAGGATSAEAGDAARSDSDPYDDALASAAYRSRVLPILVRRALDQLGG